MNVASLELCKALYELSGWAGDDSFGDMDSGKSATPAYDLGYLLRKLPQGTHIVKNTGDKPDYSCWSYLHENVDTVRADTPEDAACMLAIELFKQGVLKK
jgi:hypothetical protein